MGRTGTGDAFLKWPLIQQANPAFCLSVAVEQDADLAQVGRHSPWQSLADQIAPQCRRCKRVALLPLASAEPVSFGECSGKVPNPLTYRLAYRLAYYAAID